MSIDQLLISLQPYLKGILYMDNNKPLVNVQFKADWVLIENPRIEMVKTPDIEHQYMLIAKNDVEVSLNDLLEHVSVNIKANIEREKKHELLKSMVEDLKKLFKSTSLEKLHTLKFVFDVKDDLNLDISNIDLVEQPPIKHIPLVKVENSDRTDLPKVNIQLPEQPVFDDNAPYQDNLTTFNDDEQEILEEERRAANYQKIRANGGFPKHKNKVKNGIELPPRGAKKMADMVIAEHERDFDNPSCECGPDQACSKCIHLKDL